MKVADLSAEDIRQMRGELDVDRYLPKMPPPAGREYWDTYRIVQTLENMQKQLAERVPFDEVACRNCHKPHS
jgi:hypothetical protein